uniref:3FTx-Ver-130 n=1 Tax=Vermicella annulata TaxID=1295044 RepID=R4G7L9_9SAUR
MKTLLLTLVVVTIVCLDLGYTLKCHITGSPNDYVVCKEHETVCFQKTVSPFRDRMLVLRGCSTPCPEGDNAMCCSTDMCNK